MPVSVPGGCRAVSLQERGWGCIFCRVEKQLYPFGEDQGRLPALLGGELEDQTLAEEQTLFFSS